MKNFEEFKRIINREFLEHPVVVHNMYTEWFAQGLASPDQMIDLIEQFSVFSNHFLVVQVKRMVYAGTEEGERCARNILVNECGVALDTHSGSAEGKTFSTANAHINWLREIGIMLGLEPMRLGRWDLGTKSTHRFLKGFDQTYGNPDGQVGAGASFAIENWAAFGIGQGPKLESVNFWKQLIDGAEGFNRHQRLPNGLPSIPLGFFQYHLAMESSHADNVWHELEETFHAPSFDAKRFLLGGRIALDAIETFWKGLDETRKRLEPRSCLQGEHPTAMNLVQWAV